jgi:hypothetical protein
LDSSGNNLLGENFALIDLETRRALSEDDVLAIDRVYYFELSIPNTLGIGAHSIPEFILGSEQEYLQEIGPNLKRELVREIAMKWAEVGHSFGVESLGGRSKHESKLMIALITAIAMLTDGYITFASDDFGIELGIYTPEVFRAVKPKF